MKILNLGCGTKVSSSPEIINIDWSIYLRLKKNRILRIAVPWFVKGERLERFNLLKNNVMAHDLSKGIPYDTNSIDVVYHSHVLEHFDRNVAYQFLSEVKRVLKPNGIHRIVVPDFEKACSAYMSHVSVCAKHPDEVTKHDLYIGEIIEQSVRKEAFGTSRQPAIRRFIENLILGDARRRGETHQWMYDRINISNLLISNGFKRPRIQQYNTSIIPDWNEYGLDLDERGNEYKPDSVYVEVEK